MRAASAAARYGLSAHVAPGACAYSGCESTLWSWIPRGTGGRGARGAGLGVDWFVRHEALPPGQVAGILEEFERELQRLHPT